MAGIDLSQLNAGQRAVVERLDEPLFVAAGAGSGKTFTLTARLVHALSEGSGAGGGRYLASIDDALVITFTEAAALEIKERVRQALRAAGAEDAFLYDQSLRIDGAWISTIHGMCVRILRRHALELGIDPAFQVGEGSVTEALYARALEEVLGEVVRDDAYAALRAEYPLWSAARGAYGVDTMIGKLRGEAAKCPHGFDDFDCPASDETFSAVARLVCSLESLAGLKLTAKQQETADAALAAVEPLMELPFGERTPGRACEALAGLKLPLLRKADQKELLAEAKEAYAEAVVIAQQERVQALAPQLVALARKVDERYGELKRDHSYLDNDDLITLALRAVETSPEVAAHYAGRFRLVMIDEFQDTDEKQLRLISLLSGPGARHLTTVGDAQQSIYRFRGGDVAVFRARGAALDEASHVKMDVNYRSDPSVLALVERVCGDAGLLGDFLKLAADAGRRGKLEARAPEGQEPRRIHLEVTAGGTSAVLSAVQAAQVADRLAAYHAAGQSMGSMALLLGRTSEVGLYLDALRARGLDAVVTGGSSFSRTPEVGVVQALLHTLANPHDSETGLFRVLSSDLFRLDADDFCQLGTCRQELLDAPTKRAIERCFLEGDLALFGDAEPSARLRRAHEVLCRAFDRLGRWQLADICQAVVEESGWLRRLEGRGTDGMPVAANVLAAIRYVRELTVGLGLGPARAAAEFDRWLKSSKLTPASLVGEEVDAVKVMTVHGSKGLQFPVTAVAECWGNPKLAGRLSVGRHEGRCIVCALPGVGPSGYTKLRGQLPRPATTRDCATVADWTVFLEDGELAAEQQEKARLLYVALTRAEEALVVGLPIAGDKRYLSVLAAGALAAFPELDELEAGEREVEVSPRLPIACERRERDGQGRTVIRRDEVEVGCGLARVVMLERQGKAAGDPWLASSAGTLAGFDAMLPASVSLIPTLGTGQGSAPEVQEPFMLYGVEGPRAATRPWRPRAGVFSYSSAHELLAGERASEPGKDTTPAQGTGAGMVGGDTQAAGSSQVAGTAAAAPPPRPQLPTRQQLGEPADDEGQTDDADRATSLGSAFHVLAQTMVETGRDHDPARLEALARSQGISERQRRRLEAAIARWERSDIRSEALGHDVLRAEAPFFQRVESAYGDYVEGAIDLLCTDVGSTSALVIDYKTGDRGLSLEEISARHEMQANFYASVLMGQGFEEVDCAFVCVEREGGDGQPLVVRYAFDARNPPHM